MNWRPCLDEHVRDSLHGRDLCKTDHRGPDSCPDALVAGGTDTTGRHLRHTLGVSADGDSGQALTISAAMRRATGGYAPRFSPSLGASLLLADGVRIFCNAGTAWKIPSLDDLFWPATAFAAGNDRLRPESSWTLDSGVRLVPLEGLQFRVTGFLQHVVDMIHWQPSAGGVWRPANIGEVLAHGLETVVEWAYPVNPVWNLHMQAEYSLQVNRVRAFDSTDGSQIPRTPHEKASASVSLRHRTMGMFRFAAGYTGFRYLNMANTKYLGDHLLVDTSLEIRIESTGRSAPRWKHFRYGRGSFAGISPSRSGMVLLWRYNCESVQRAFAHGATRSWSRPAGRQSSCMAPVLPDQDGPYRDSFPVDELWVVNGLSETIGLCNLQRLEADVLPWNANPLFLTGRVPNRIVIDGTNGLVVNSSGNSITVFALRQPGRQREYRLPTGSNPWDARFIHRPGRSLIAVTSFLRNSLFILDAATGESLRELLFPEGTRPQGMALSGSDLWIALSGWNFSTGEYDPGGSSSSKPRIRIHCCGQSAHPRGCPIPRKSCPIWPGRSMFFQPGATEKRRLSPGL